MDLQHSFSVPIPIDQAWEAFNDLERIAPCFPGAQVTSVDGDDFAGLAKVKLGPIALQYTGTGRWVERDRDGYRAVIEANGKDKRGNGTAGAVITARLQEEPGGTRVVVDTSLKVTGRPAQFGRGVMQDVGNKLLDQFASCLTSRLGAGGDTAAGEPTGDRPAAAAAGEPRGGGTQAVEETEQQRSAQEQHAVAAQHEADQQEADQQEADQQEADQQRSAQEQQTVAAQHEAEQQEADQQRSTQEQHAVADQHEAEQQEADQQRSAQEQQAVADQHEADQQETDQQRSAQEQHAVADQRPATAQTPPAAQPPDDLPDLVSEPVVAARTGPRTSPSGPARDTPDEIDMGSLVGGVVARRYGPAVAATALLVAVAVAWLVARRRR